MVDHWLRRPKEQVLTPLASLVGRKISPTKLTLLAFAMGLVAAVLIINRIYWLGFIFWLLNRIIDGLDGTVARKTATQSDWGGYLDIMLDTFIYALIPISLVIAAPAVAHWAALAALLGSYYINAVSWAYLAAILEKRQAGASAQGEMTSVTMPTGLIEGTETVIFFSAFIIFAPWIFWLFWTMTILVIITFLQRMIWAGRILGGL